MSLASWAFIAIGAHAHPLFNGILMQGAEDLSDAYDYVVVGGGATGLTVANRLSEDAGAFRFAYRAIHVRATNDLQPSLCWSSKQEICKLKGVSRSGSMSRSQHLSVTRTRTM